MDEDFVQFQGLFSEYLVKDDGPIRDTHVSFVYTSGWYL